MSGLSVQRRGAGAYAYFYILFLLVLFLTHSFLLHLPYFWDEMGQFIPAALDILHDNAWIPRTTLPNVHPPGVMAYLAAIWSVVGYSVVITRCAMLALAAAGVLAVFALAVHLCKGSRGLPAFTAAFLLLASPLFYSQSMMAQLDMPAMVFTAIALLLFLNSDTALAAFASYVPSTNERDQPRSARSVRAACCCSERRWRDALLFRGAGDCACCFGLRISTKVPDQLFGNAEFTHYNVGFQLHPDAPRRNVDSPRHTISSSRTGTLSDRLRSYWHRSGPRSSAIAIGQSLPRSASCRR